MTSKGRTTLLVLRHHGLGDLVTVQPALRALRRSFPGHELVVTCPSWLLPLAHLLGSADRWVAELSRPSSVPDRGVDPRCHRDVDGAVLANVLQQIHTADVVVSLRTPGPELLPLVAALEPRLLVSYRYPALAATAEFPTLDFSEHILMRWKRLLRCVGVDPQEVDFYSELQVAQARRGFTIVHVGAGSPSRIWPVERWAAVVRHLEATAHRVLLTGSRGEVPLVEEVRRRARLPADRNRAGVADIAEVVCLVAGARLLLCGDTGISHLATAFRRPAVTLFGPVPPAWWGPPPGNPQHRTLWKGRTGDNYADEVDPGLLQISVECVLAAVDELDRRGLL